MSSYDYASKLELKEAIHASYLRFDGEFQEIDESQKDIRIPEVDKTPANGDGGLTPVCETGIKTPCKFKQPVVGNLPATGYLVSLESELSYSG
ncbi:hypothetical protein MKY24_01285 [Paenibacillus sp. FSL P2-0322]|uniref:hypothetical protein n=1 Tax=Paenibacillus sp. FSL P2-0322 TaxID=2921628 RepID=UPI0030CCACAB